MKVTGAGAVMTADVVTAEYGTPSTAHLVGRSIVVGVDGSEASVAALRWAVEQARALRAEVVALHAWEATASHLAPYAPVAARPTAGEERDAARRLLTETLHRAFGQRIDSAVHAELAEGQAVRVLLNRAQGALMLALGRTTDVQGVPPQVGPVGRECLRRSSVPVVAVPVGRAPDGAQSSGEPAVGPRRGSALGEVRPARGVRQSAGPRCDREARGAVGPAQREQREETQR